MQAALPALKRAQEAVDGIQAADVNEVKSNRNPNELIKYIFDAIVIFFQSKLLPITIVDYNYNKKENKSMPFLKDSYDDAGKGILSDIQFL